MDIQTGLSPVNEKEIASVSAKKPNPMFGMTEAETPLSDIKIQQSDQKIKSSKEKKPSVRQWAETAV